MVSAACRMLCRALMSIEDARINCSATCDGDVM